MDSPIVTRLFRQLFRHPARACHSRRNLATLSSFIRHSHGQAERHRRNHHQRRLMSSPRDSRRGGAQPAQLQEKEAHWQQRTDMFRLDKTEEYQSYPLVTAEELRSHRQRPRRVKMLMRDFVDDSLYNPHYGYFSKQVVIFSPGEPFDFPSLPDEPAFHRQLGQRYTEFEDKLDLVNYDRTRQLWHTPTEMFRPFYGEAIARYLMANYVMSTYPYHDLVIYEMGAGRGTLMLNILDYIRRVEPALYARTQYRIIEISGALARLQADQLLATAASRGHADKVEIVNRSIFDWREPVPEPCFFLAMEVWDNFAHDSLRYDLRTEEPLQGVVLIDAEGDFHEFYEPSLDPVAARYLRVREAATAGRYPLPHPLNSTSNSPFSVSRASRWLRSHMPLAPNLSDPEYIPTRLMQFFDILERYFPTHRLLTSDFHTLPDAVRGLNSPVVQTRFERRMVPVTTPLVHQGYFDILFPTDFGVNEAIYRAITGRLSRVVPHESFMQSWAYLEDTRVRSGENPLLTWYRNASVMMTV